MWGKPLKPLITETPNEDLSDEDLSDLPEANPIGLCTPMIDLATYGCRSRDLYVIKGYPGLWIKKPDLYPYFGTSFRKNLDILIQSIIKKNTIFARIQGCAMTGYFVRAKAEEEKLEEGAKLTVLERNQEKIDADVQRTLSKIREKQIEAKEKQEQDQKQITSPFDELPNYDTIETYPLGLEPIFRNDYQRRVRVTTNQESENDWEESYRFIQNMMDNVFQINENEVDRDNVCCRVEVQRQPASFIQNQVNVLLETAGIRLDEKLFPPTSASSPLSGGQQQKTENGKPTERTV